MASRLRRLSRPLFSLFLLSLPAAAAPGNFVQWIDVTAGLSFPVGVTHAGDGSGRLFIVQQSGRIRIWTGTQLLATPFLDLSPITSPCSATTCGERGLLGLAFHPDYAANGLFYVYYTRRDDPATAGDDENGDIFLARYQVSANPDVADSASGTVLLRIEHSSQGNHNGGHIAFRDGGYLYIATGDGGSFGDPAENGQNINTLLGKILRIDVGGDDFPGDPNRNYAIPPGNPFAGAAAGADEIWAYGLRNPWRFSFDRATGDLFIGDVGQGIWEEIDFQAAGSPGGQNYGWDCREGAHDYTDPQGSNAGCGAITSADPILEYNHSENGQSVHCSVTGGYVFRNLPSHSYHGSYLYGDFCSGRIWRGIPDGFGGWTSQTVPVTSTFGLTSFGEGETGRIYLTYLTTGFLRWLAPYTFQDVTPTFWAWPHIEALFENGITTGCDATPRYCAGDLTSRAEMAIFLIRATRGAGFVPPPATGVFADVPADLFAAPWIEQLYRDGITTGCAANPLRYCPALPVNRAEMAVFLLRARNGAGHTPPPATGTVFADVSAGFWAAGWIEELHAVGITTGCAASPLRYCPGGNANRAEMAAFLARTFNLSLP